MSGGGDIVLECGAILGRGTCFPGRGADATGCSVILQLTRPQLGASQRE